MSVCACTCICVCVCVFLIYETKDICESKRRILSFLIDYSSHYSHQTGSVIDPEPQWSSCQETPQIWSYRCSQRRHTFFFSTCFSFLFNAHLWIDIIFSEVASPHDSDLDDHTQVLLLGGKIQRNWRFRNRKPIFLLWRIWLICSHKGDNTGLKWATNQLFFPSTKN